jgi:hypothetical protein
MSIGSEALVTISFSVERVRLFVSSISSIESPESASTQIQYSFSAKLAGRLMLVVLSTVSSPWMPAVLTTPFAGCVSGSKSVSTVVM